MPLKPKFYRTHNVNNLSCDEPRKNGKNNGKAKLFDARAVALFERKTALNAEKLRKIKLLIDKEGKVIVPPSQTAKKYLQNITFTANKIAEEIALGKRDPKDLVEFPESITSIQLKGLKQPDGSRNYEIWQWKFKTLETQSIPGTSRTFNEVKVYPVDGTMGIFTRLHNGKIKWMHRPETNQSTHMQD